MNRFINFAILLATCVQMICLTLYENILIFVLQYYIKDQCYCQVTNGNKILLFDEMITNLMCYLYEDVLYVTIFKNNQIISENKSQTERSCRVTLENTNSKHQTQND